jgi:hypothetical protein
MTEAAKKALTHPDPLTKRLLSDRCWNGFHELAADKKPMGDCEFTGCQCYCHEMRRLERAERAKKAEEKREKMAAKVKKAIKETK